MTIGEYLGIKPRIRNKHDRISNKDRAKIRHDHAVLINAGKKSCMVVDYVAFRYKVSVSSIYRIIK